MTRLPATVAFAGASAFLAVSAIVIAVDAVERRDWLRGALALFCAGGSVALADETVAYWTRRLPTISWIVFSEFRLHPLIWVAGFAAFMVLVGALAHHFTHDSRSHWGLLALGVVAYAIGTVLADRWIPNAP